MKNKILFAIIPFILSIGIVSVLPFIDALQENDGETECRDEYVVVHRYQKNDYACLSMELAKSWEALKLGEIVNSEPIKQSSPPSQISEDSQTTSMPTNTPSLEGLFAKQLRCKEGFNLVIKGVDGSTACVKPSSVQKLIESGWISIGSDFARDPELETQQTSSESKITTQLDFLPNDSDRAMYFTARFSEGLIPTTEVLKSHFIKFIPFKDYGFQINPENPLPKKPPFKFLLETLPSKENIGYYVAIDDYFQIDSTLFKEFDVSIDVITGDGTLLQTWEYMSCDLEDFSVYLQDNIIFDRFTGYPGPEIRERSIFHCSSYSLVVPEN